MKRCFNGNPIDVCWFIGVINFASSARLPTELYTSSVIDRPTWQPHIRRGAINLRLSITHRLTLSLVRIHSMAFAGRYPQRHYAIWKCLLVNIIRVYRAIRQFWCCGRIVDPSMCRNLDQQPVPTKSSSPAYTSQRRCVLSTAESRATTCMHAGAPGTKQFYDLKTIEDVERSRPPRVIQQFWSPAHAHNES